MDDNKLLQESNLTQGSHAELHIAFYRQLHVECGSNLQPRGCKAPNLYEPLSQHATTGTQDVLPNNY